MVPTLRLIVLGIAIVSLAIGSSTAQEWTRFRGPNGSGVSDAKTAPVSWTAEDYNWTLDLPGAGHSSPVVWGDRLFVTAADAKTHERWLIAVDTSVGKIVGQKAFPFAEHHKHGNNSFATSTPAVDAGHVYVLWQSSEDSQLVALDHDLAQQWVYELGPFKGGHGPAVSPIVYEDLAIVANDQDGESSLVALDCATGEPRWKIARETTRASYSTPCVFRLGSDSPQLIFTEMHHGVTSVDPKSGRVNWEISVFGTFKQRAIASPVVTDDLVIGLSGFTTAEKNAVAVRPVVRDGKTAAEEVWRVSKAVPHLPTPLVYGGRLFLWTDRGGIVTCVDAAHGEEIWQKRIGGNFSSSPICIDGKIYCANDDGVVYVIRAADEFELLGKSELGDATRATPAVSGGVVYFRTESKLFSLGGH